MKRHRRRPAFRCTFQSSPKMNRAHDEECSSCVGGQVFFRARVATIPKVFFVLFFRRLPSYAPDGAIRSNPRFLAQQWNAMFAAFRETPRDREYINHAQYCTPEKKHPSSTGTLCPLHERASRATTCLKKIDRHPRRCSYRRRHGIERSVHSIHGSPSNASSITRARQRAPSLAIVIVQACTFLMSSPVVSIQYTFA